MRQMKTVHAPKQDNMTITLNMPAHQLHRFGHLNLKSRTFNDKRRKPRSAERVSFRREYN